MCGEAYEDGAFWQEVSANVYFVNNKLT